MTKRILVTGLSAILLASCSDNVSPPESALNGHWLHNPGQCELKIQTQGLFDLKIEDGSIHVGDSKNPLPGKWTKYRDSQSIKDRAMEWLENCSTATFSSEQIDKADTFLLSSPIQDVYFIELPNRWLMIDDNDVRLLLPFDDVKSMELPIEYPENLSKGGSTPSNNT